MNVKQSLARFSCKWTQGTGASMFCHNNWCAIKIAHQSMGWYRKEMQLISRPDKRLYRNCRAPVRRFDCFRWNLLGWLAKCKKNYLIHNLSEHCILHPCLICLNALQKKSTVGIINLILAKTKVIMPGWFSSNLTKPSSIIDFTRNSISHRSLCK